VSVITSAFRFLLGPSWWAPDRQRLRAAVGGRVVLVTGASSGIGAATARMLGDAGATVLLVARRAELLDDVRREIAAAGGVAAAYPADLTDGDAVDALVAAVLADHGRVDVVVSNAGKSIRRSQADTTDRFHDITRTNAVNYLGPVRLVGALLPGMRERRGGHIVNVSTVGVDVPTAHWAAYTASKAAFETWLRCVSGEVRGDRVAVTSIHFPLVHTPMAAPTYAPSMPGLTAEDAAGVICRALVTRPRVLTPWWVRFARPAVELAQGPYDAASAAVLARTSRRPARNRRP
jgi:NAD(P)-dependent dehydrogenase (short-subunit alcohol dehydrogenase family)